MIRISAPLLLVVLLLTSCATSRNPTAALPRFNEAEQADFIIRYYSDDTSYVLKPATTEGVVPDHSQEGCGARLG